MGEAVRHPVLARRLVSALVYQRQRRFRWTFRVLLPTPSQLLLCPVLAIAGGARSRGLVGRRILTGIGRGFIGNHGVSVVASADEAKGRASGGGSLCDCALSSGHWPLPARRLGGVLGVRVVALGTGDGPGPASALQVGDPRSGGELWDGDSLSYHRYALLYADSPGLLVLFQRKQTTGPRNSNVRCGIAARCGSQCSLLIAGRSDER